MRNVLIAIGNSGNSALAAHARNLLDDSSPLVRGMAIWALSKLLPEQDFSALSARAALETDGSVRTEWAMASR